MTISVWRYSHLALAVSSFLFIALASVTGIILAFKPVTEKAASYRVSGFDKATVAQTVAALKNKYPEIIDISVDANQFVTLKGSDADFNTIKAYVDPATGKVLGKPAKPNEFFEWITALHRSLFLHEVGRFFVGLTAFLLALIAISGTILVIQRQRGIKRFFTKVYRAGFAQYYHVILGRLMLVPIIIIALTGTYVSLSRFGLFPEFKAKHKIDFDKISQTPKRQPSDFAIFKSTPLASVQSIEFPFSDDPEDYYTLKLTDRELVVDQFTGDVLSKVKYPSSIILTNLSLDIHTGRTNAVWAVILAIAAANILFFIWSGFAITLKRRANRSKNKYKADECEYITLVGSENGSTFGYATAVHKQLLGQGKRSYITELNSYARFAKAEHILIMTATYGLGDAPTNAAKFEALLQKHPQLNNVTYSVLGLGSHAYPDFCRFAFEVNQLMTAQTWATALIDIHTVDDKSPADFALWAEAWAQQTGVQLDAVPASASPQNLRKLSVTSNTTVGTNGHTFLLKLKLNGGIKVQSGDLLAIYPANDHRERLYSIGVVDKQLQLSVRLHLDGLGSSYLHELRAGDTIKAKIVNNSHFHFPTMAPEVVMISNGTGIAPFLGMMCENDRRIPLHLYCGFREGSSFKVYQEHIKAQQDAGKLATVSLALSRSENKQYVSDLLKQDANKILQTLQRGGVLMICGSLAMQKDVLALLEDIGSKDNNKPLSYYQSHSQILMDCY